MDSTASAANYSVVIDPKTLEITVSLLLSGEAVTDGMILTIPNWVAGDYDFEPYGRDLFEVTAIGH
ncbi:MAG: putative metalloprotease with PDZ domain [Paraglaciecola sp.]|jgi:predicted metalloprotease with PDZ domain